MSWLCFSGSPDKTNNEGSTSLHLAAGNGHLACLQYLTNFGGNVHALNDNGVTPMQESSIKGQLECVRHLEDIVTHQVAQDRTKVEKMQNKAKKELEKRIKEREKLMKTIDKSYDKKAAKQRKFFGVPLSANPNNPYNLDGADKLSYSQLTGMTNGGQHSRMNRSSDDMNEYENSNIDNDSIDSFQRIEEEFLTRTSQISDDIVFERPEKSSIKTDQTDVSGGSSSTEISIKQPGMLASLNSLYSSSSNGSKNGSYSRSYNGYLNGYPQNGGGGGGYPTRKPPGGSSTGTGGFGSSQHLSASIAGRSHGSTLPPSKRNGRPVGYREVHMGPLYTFLHSLGMDEFRDVFLREKIDLSACLLCEENDLKDIGLPLGDRKKLMSAINKRNQIMRDAASDSTKELFDSAIWWICWIVRDSIDTGRSMGVVNSWWVW